MLTKSMLLNKKIKSQIEIPYFYMSGILENINANYFIEKMEKGFKQEENKNFSTNVKGFMTSWTFFNDDLEFLKLLWPFYDLIEKEIPKLNFRLVQSWGIRNDLGSYTKLHDHIPAAFSGVIYLNDHNQLLNFPQINETLKPSIGSFAIFNSFLKHHCVRSLDIKPKYGISFNCNHAGL
jgi:hypothetical protein